MCKAIETIIFVWLTDWPGEDNFYELYDTTCLVYVKHGLNESKKNNDEEFQHYIEENYMFYDLSIYIFSFFCFLTWCVY